MASITYKCVKCDKEFKPGEWDCFPGEQHSVTEKSYYVPNSCADVADRAKSRLLVVVDGEREWTDSEGQKHTNPAEFVEFVRGIHTTTNPKHQFFFDTRYKASLIDKDTWQTMYITREDQQQMKERSLANREKEFERRENELLAKEKSARGK